MKQSVFDWILAEPKPPHAYVSKPEPTTTAETFAIHSEGLKPGARLKIAATPAVLCFAPRIRQSHIMKRAPAMTTFERLQVAVYAPKSRLNEVSRAALTPGRLENNVLACLKPEFTPDFEMNLYTLIYRPEIRNRFRKARDLLKSEEERVYMACLARDWAGWRRRALVGKIVDPIAKEYFELKTGVKL